MALRLSHEGDDEDDDEFGFGEEEDLDEFGAADDDDLHGITLPGEEDADAEVSARPSEN